MATDFSEGSDEAIDRAIEMAKQSAAEVEILHVVELAEEFPMGALYFNADYSALYADVDLELARRADRFTQGRAGVHNQDRRGQRVHRDRGTRPGDRRRPDRRWDARPHRPRARHAGQRRGARGQAGVLPGADRPLLPKKAA